ncbi:MAG: CCA tRNA nucleotidyltransferase, partial [Gemmataceae bacterium]
VQFSSPQEDAQRRDFTINGLFQDPITGNIIDYVDGQIDLRNRVLRAIGDPVERFREDKLRILRAARMAARFALAIDAETLAAARGLASEVTVVSAERISEEFRKMLAHPARGLALRHLTALGLAPVLLPEVELEHWFAPQHTQLPATAEWTTAFASLAMGFHPKQLVALAERWKLSNAEAQSLQWLAASIATIRQEEVLPRHVLFPILAHPEIEELFALLHAWCPDHHNYQQMQEFRRSLPKTTFQPPPILDGAALIRLGFKPSPLFKRVLEEVRRQQLDGILSTPNQAELVAINLLQGHIQ